ncbi:MAG: hypothetical protein Q4E53_10640 [Eubacteriales bacterium]|nr:hypothetical protein [Eubacteriales bacterium]
MEKEKKGLYHNDYSPRYQPSYNIYEKAKNHMKEQKKQMRDLKEKEKVTQMDQ